MKDTPPLTSIHKISPFLGAINMSQENTYSMTGCLPPVFDLDMIDDGDEEMSTQIAMTGLTITSSRQSSLNSSHRSSIGINDLPSPLPIPELQSIEFGDELEEPSKSTLHKTKLHKRASSVKFGVGASSQLQNPDGTIFCKIELPSGLPKSELLNTKQLLIDQLYELYLKYIECGSDHEINISGAQRQQIADIFNKVKNGDITPQTGVEGDDAENSYDNEMDQYLFHVMDAACIEVLKIMVHSYKRYCLTPEGKIQIFNV